MHPLQKSSCSAKERTHPPPTLSTKEKLYWGGGGSALKGTFGEGSLDTITNNYCHAISGMGSSWISGHKHSTTKKIRSWAGGPASD